MIHSASVRICDKGGSILRYMFSEEGILLPYIPELPYEVLKDEETGKFAITGLLPGMLRWEPAPVEQIRRITGNQGD